MILDVLRWLHVLGASVLFGTGIGIAFFMVMAHRTGRPAIIAATVRSVVLADFVFTATAVVLQPLTGVLLAGMLGWSLREGWIIASLALYVLTGLCWLPVVRLQMRLGALAAEAERSGDVLPRDYHRLFRIWLLLGIPALLAVLTIFWLMLARPDIALA